MVRFIRGLFLGAMVFALGLGLAGCGGGTDSKEKGKDKTKIKEGTDRIKNMQEQQEQLKKQGLIPGKDSKAPDKDNDTSDEKDKEKDKEDDKDKS
jgi:uncharacterized protein HemX